MAAPRLDEFARIARFFAPLAAPGALGLLDDVALIDGPPGEQYVLKTDAIVEGVHFLPDDPPARWRRSCCASISPISPPRARRRWAIC